MGIQTTCSAHTILCKANTIHDHAKAHLGVAGASEGLGEAQDGLEVIYADKGLREDKGVCEGRGGGDGAAWLLWAGS